MAKNIALQALLEQVRDERQMYANTATRVGNAMLALLEYIENADYVRKDIPETLEHILTLLKGCVVGEGKIHLNEDGSITCQRIQVNGSAVFDELVFNHQNVLEGDTYFSDRAIVDKAERTDLNQYTLTLRKMFEADEFTFWEGDIVRWSINSLIKKGEHDNGYGRVDRVSADTMAITMYSDADCPGGVNAVPVAGCRLVRHGHVNDPSRQSTFYISSRQGCFLFLQGVDKPILEDSKEGTNYSAWLGLPPDTNMVRDLLDKGLINKNQPYSFFRGIIVQDMIEVDYKGVPRYKARESVWSEDKQYYHGYDPDAKGYYTDYVWYKSLLWQASVEKPSVGVAPRYNNTDWICVRGSEDFKIDLISTRGDMFRAGSSWQTDLVATVYHGDMKLEEEEIGRGNIYWSRVWDRGEGDVAWNTLHGPGHCGLAIPISSDTDLPGGWFLDSSVRFRIDITLPQYGSYSAEYNILV